MSEKRYINTKDGTILDTVEQLELGIEETVDLLNYLVKELEQKGGLLL